METCDFKEFQFYSLPGSPNPPILSRPSPPTYNIPHFEPFLGSTALPAPCFQNKNVLEKDRSLRWALRLKKLSWKWTHMD